MIPAYFLQPDIEDPWPLYAGMTAKHPVHYDATTGSWAIYSYAFCKNILENPLAIIPPVPHYALGEFAARIKTRLARLNNGSSHSIAKAANRLLAQNRVPANIGTIMKRLLRYAGNTREIDWVDAIAKKLPALTLLESFGFYDDDAAYILERMGQLTKIMLPASDEAGTMNLNKVSEEIYLAVRRKIISGQWYKEAAANLTSTYQLQEEDALEYLTSNLTGLLIQSHDAGRGLLSNTLLSLLTIPGILKNKLSHPYLQLVVTETMRHNGPVHITRRIAKEDIEINGHMIAAGELIVLTLAAANRDPQQFLHPDQFDIARTNNNLHLGFGIGSHQCPGTMYSMALLIETMQWVFSTYKRVIHTDTKIGYEPLVNLRIPKRLLISLS
jgi:cytochrome P450